MTTSTKKKINRYFNGVKTMRLIVTVDAGTVALVDEHLSGRQPDGMPHPAADNRAEFVRLAISEKLERDAKQNSPDSAPFLMFDDAQCAKHCAISS